MGYFRTWKKVMSSPTEFFTKMPKLGYKEPTIFALKTLTFVYIVGFCIMVLFNLVWYKSPLGQYSSLVKLFPALGGAGEYFITLIAGIIFIPLGLLFAWGMLYVGAGIYHLFVLMFGGNEGYRETFTAYCYSLAPTLFSAIAIPILGSFISMAAGVYSIVLFIFGLQARQKMSGGKAAAAVLIPIGIFFVLMILFVIGIVILVGGLAISKLGGAPF
ncbi:TPA: hypothetical protein HA278_06800 [Candidatus Woesearchaeota archaeon]|nr:hypothetical protein [archaeon]HIJ11741.1 hypothetical protein [Candidatus Woesearchaeota archaeon]|tara:strand:- start:406 stop:1053 length:648 start_codon:yes stop_codon:yes gene_type:complete